MQKKLSLFVATCVLLGLSACSLLPEKSDETKNWSATKLYSEAREEMDGGHYEAAIKLFEKLEANYPFGTYAPQAQMEIAYAYYKTPGPGPGAGRGRALHQAAPESSAGRLHVLPARPDQLQRPDRLPERSLFARTRPSATRKRRAKRSPRSRNWSTSSRTANTRRTRSRA